MSVHVRTFLCNCVCLCIFAWSGPYLCVPSIFGYGCVYLWVSVYVCVYLCIFVYTCASLCRIWVYLRISFILVYICVYSCSPVHIHAQTIVLQLVRVDSSKVSPA